MNFNFLPKTPLYNAFSEIGKRIFLPKGIFYWANRAKEEAELIGTLGAAYGFEKDFINPTEDIAKRAFRNGARILNSWLFKRSSGYLDEAAKNANDLLLQQRVTLFKQLNNLLQNVISSQPDKVMKRTKKLFEDNISSIKKYDQFSKSEMEFYLKAIDSLFSITSQLQDGNTEIRTQRLLCKASISLSKRRIGRPHCQDPFQKKHPDLIYGPSGALLDQMFCVYVWLFFAIWKGS